MNRPGLFVRLAGSPRMAVMLFVGYAAIVLSWYDDGLSGWLALAAALAAIRTLSAVGQVRRYKAWLAEWQAMAGEGKPQLPRKPRGRGWLRIMGAVALVVGIPLYVNSQIKTDATFARGLAVFWCVVVLYLAVILLRKLLRLLWRPASRLPARSAARRHAEAEAAPVTWLVRRPSSSPSRADATRELPEYSARLLDRGIRNAVKTG